MNGQDFTKIIVEVVRETAISGSIEYLKELPGRKPPEELVRLSEWFKSLSEQDQENLMKIVTMAVDDSLFGFFAVLDGVRVIEDDDKGLLELNYIKNDKKILINNPNQEFLHDMYNGIDK